MPSFAGAWVSFSGLMVFKACLLVGKISTKNIVPHILRGLRNNLIAFPIPPLDAGLALHHKIVLITKAERVAIR